MDSGHPHMVTPCLFCLFCLFSGKHSGYLEMCPPGEDQGPCSDPTLFPCLCPCHPPTCPTPLVVVTQSMVAPTPCLLSW